MDFLLGDAVPSTKPFVITAFEDDASNKLLSVNFDNFAKAPSPDEIAIMQDLVLPVDLEDDDEFILSFKEGYTWNSGESVKFRILLAGLEIYSKTYSDEGGNIKKPNTTNFNTVTKTIKGSQFKVNGILDNSFVIQVKLPNNVSNSVDFGIDDISLVRKEIHLLFKMKMVRGLLKKQ